MSAVDAGAARSRSDPDDRWPLIGRDELIGEIVRASGAAVVLRGPSGVGKTRVAQAVVARLAAAGWASQTLSGGTSFAGLPLAGIAPLFAGADPDLTALSENPLALAEYTLARTAELARGRRMVFLVDDISLMDALSLTLLTQLVHTGTITMIATLRAGDPVPDPILAMWTGDAARSFEVRPFRPQDSQQMATAALGGEVAQRAVAQLHAASDGNPLFLRELILGAVDAGMLAERAGVWQLMGAPVATPALRDLIMSRIRHLDPAVRDVLDRIALCQPLPIDELHATGARSALGDLEIAGLVAISRTSMGPAASLSHPQYVAAVVASLPQLRAMDLLLEQADIATAKNRQPLDAVRAATWRLQAGHPSDPDLLVGAARFARLANDFAETARLTQAAVDAGSDRADVHLMHADALRALGRTDEAMAALDRASAADASSPGSSELTTEIATTIALTHADRAMGISRGLEHLDEALRRLPGQAEAIALTRSVLLLYNGLADLAVAEIDAVRGAAVAGRTAHDEARVAMAAAIPLASVGRATEALAAAGTAVGYARNPANGRGAITARAALFVQASALIRTGDVHRARDTATEALQEAIEHDDEIATRHAELTLGHCFSEIGRLRTAGRWFRDAVSGAEAKGPNSFRGPALGGLALTMIWRGDSTGARAVLARQSPEVAAWDISTILGEAWLDCEAGRSTAAIPRLLLHANGYQQTGYSYIAGWFLFNVARLGHAAEVADPLAELAARGDSPLFAARSAHAVALAAADPEGLVTVGEQWERLGSMIYAAEGYAGAAQLATARQDARGAARLRQRAEQLVGRCEGVATPALRFATSAVALTARERQIAGLARNGMSSREIATTLVLSVRTVDNHLQSAYAKLGVSSRSELVGID